MEKIGEIILPATQATLLQVSGTVDDIESAVTVIDGIVDTINGNVGAKTDLVTVPYVEGNSVLAFLHTGYYHVHGASFVYPKYADPILLTSNAAAWNTTGTIVEIIPANTITKNFDLHWIEISDISANCYFIVDIFTGEAGAEVLIGSVAGHRGDTFSAENPKPVQVPQIPANTRISCRLSDSTSSAKTVRVKFEGHVYSATL